jgi:hypothetical protein
MSPSCLPTLTRRLTTLVAHLFPTYRPVAHMESPHDCLLLLNFLISRFQSLQESLEIELRSAHSIGQIAVDFVEKHSVLADQWIQEWSQDDEEEESKKKEMKLTFYEFLVLCELHIDSYPDIADGLRTIEKLFLPSCSMINPLESSQNTSRSQESGKLTGRRSKK